MNIVIVFEINSQIPGFSGFMRAMQVVSSKAVGDCQRIKGRQNPKANIFELLQGWLNDARTGEWVLILDSLDDDEYLHAIPSEQ